MSNFSCLSSYFYLGAPRDANISASSSWMLRIVLRYYGINIIILPFVQQPPFYLYKSINNLPCDPPLSPSTLMFSTRPASGKIMD